MKFIRIRKNSENLQGSLLSVIDICDICEGLYDICKCCCLCCNCLNFAINKSSSKKEKIAKVRGEIAFDKYHQMRRGTLTEGICPECQCSYEKGTQYCPNCGIELKK